MASRSSVLAWRIPGTGGGLVSYSPWRRKRVGHDWSDLAGTHVERSSYQAVLTIYKCQSSSLDGAYSVA